MVFSSLIFLFCFLPLVLLIYFAVPKRFKNLILLIASLIFYAWGEPVYIVLMLFSIAVNYIHGRLIERCKAEDNVKAARRALISSVIINLALLGFFKYTDFFIASANTLFGAKISLLGLPLPIGISFYTFQIMSYIIDVYRGATKAQHSIISFGAYVSLFPQLIAGPIVRYQTIAEQLDERTVTADKFGSGATRFMVGLGKKVLIANNLGMLWDTVSGADLSTLPVLTAWLGIIAFTFQIYFDFSGYSDMAIGLGRMFGFDFLENFEHPYMSKSITEFWRRWHISLGTWFREYVYIPLGGNRCSRIKQLRNIASVWLLTGFWHGAGWNFIAWGAFFGLLLIVEKNFLLKRLERLPSAVSHLYTMLLVVISWVLFSLESVSDITAYLGAMFGANHAGFVGSGSVYMLLTNLILFSVAAIGSTNLPKKLADKLNDRTLNRPAASELMRAAFMIIVFVISVAYLVDSSFNPFLYFRF